MRLKEKAKFSNLAFSEFGSPTWARTRDLRINSPSLYRLSYRGMGRIIMAGKNVSINIFKKMVQNISNV